MNRSIAWIAVLGLGCLVACGGDETQDAAKSAKDAAGNAAAAAKEMARDAGEGAAEVATGAAEAATGAAGTAAAAARDAVGAMGGDAASTCRALAAREAWGEALEVCKKAHEMLPDDLELEHAYQMAKAAAE